MDIPKYITGSQLLNKYGMRGFQLLEHVINGLQPYDKVTGKPIPPPSVVQRLSELRELEYSINIHQDALMKLEGLSDDSPDPDDPRTIPVIEGEGSYPGGGGQNVRKRTARTVRESKQEYRSLIKKKKDRIKTIREELPSDMSWKSYNLPNSQIRMEAVLRRLSEEVFNEEEFLKLIERQAAAEATHQEINKRQSAIFPCAPGTKWQDIRITLVALDMVKIKTPLGEDRFTYHELGMAHGMNKEPLMVWGILILFAKNHGVLSKQDFQKERIPGTATAGKRGLSDMCKNLNRHLKTLFKIEESIFKDHYNKYKKYETKILFSDYTQVAT
jgi:hypothetical protein